MDFRIGITFADLLIWIYVYIYVLNFYLPRSLLSAMLPVARNGLCRHPFFSQV